MYRQLADEFCGVDAQVQRGAGSRVAMLKCLGALILCFDDVCRLSDG